MNKTTVIQIRVTPEEKAAIQKRADKNGKKVGAFLRDLALQGVSLETLGSIGDQKAQAEEEAAEIVGAPREPVTVGREFIDQMAAIAKDPGARLPTTEEVDELALEIHNTEGEPMRAAMAIALHRLSR